MSLLSSSCAYSQKNLQEVAYIKLFSLKIAELGTCFIFPSYLVAKLLFFSWIAKSLQKKVFAIKFAKTLLKAPKNRLSDYSVSQVNREHESYILPKICLSAYIKCKFLLRLHEI